MQLRELRQKRGMTQAACAQYLGIPLRTYKRYEADEGVIPPIKKGYILRSLDAASFDEEHGIYSVGEIARICAEVFSAYEIDYCYLFGSYAKGRATGKSDVDLLVCTPTTGLKYFGLVEKLRSALKKQVDVLDERQLVGNDTLLGEILKDGIKIYG